MVSEILTTDGIEQKMTNLDDMSKLEEGEI
jgi:hypothetical protein